MKGMSRIFTNEVLIKATGFRGFIIHDILDRKLYAKNFISHFLFDEYNLDLNQIDIAFIYHHC